MRYQGLIVLTLSALLGACGTAPGFPRFHAPTGLTFDRRDDAVLFTASDAANALDFRLWLTRDGTTKRVPLKLTADELVLGAAFEDAETAIVAIRSGNEDRIARLNLTTGEATTLTSGEKAGFGLLELDSLTVTDDRASFLASYEGSEPEADGHGDVRQTVFALDLTSGEVERLDLASQAAKDFEAKRVSNAKNAFRTRAVAPGVAWLAFPKKLASRPVYGSPYHTGNDLYAVDLNRGAGDDDLGDGVIAAAPGQVVFSGWNSQGYGNLVIVRHANGLQTYYAHLSKTAVTTGANVYAGQWIGNVGNTGQQNMAAHLHFMVRDPSLPSGYQSVKAATTSNPTIAFGPSVSGSASTCPVSDLIGDVTYEYRVGC
ncbi:M23 family metallopeptidase [Deinococcus yavapaiensis]|uniref:Peptidase M23-like protein n=1 Tax=Deinococcus yavapaiensis KR-236 TaxID=694435 RepID=A0A318SC79_9DEIO|nr:M23 family metallopeptidase [Deinococcus yavapaiensis]PYE56618.1 peptidase M23-like protein [Deinococcus yavapaiensis KR-236]